MRFSVLLSFAIVALVQSFVIKPTRLPAARTMKRYVSPDILIDNNFNLAAGSLVLGTACGVLENFKGITARFFGAGAIIFTLFGGFIAFQTNSLRFKFSDDSFALVKSDGSSIGENVVVGGENSWKYKSFVNYDFLPRYDSIVFNFALMQILVIAAKSSRI